MRGLLHRRYSTVLHSCLGFPLCTQNFRPRVESKFSLGPVPGIGDQVNNIVVQSQQWLVGLETVLWNLTFPWNRVGAVIAADVSEQSVLVVNQVGWGAGGGGFFRGGRNSQQPLAQAPLLPLSCLHVSGRVSLAGNLMQM